MWRGGSAPGYPVISNSANLPLVSRESACTVINAPRNQTDRASRESIEVSCKESRAVPIFYLLAYICGRRERFGSPAQHFALKKSFGDRPIAFYGRRRNFERIGSLFDRQTGKIAQLHDAAL